jgi:hypothetical protein
MHLAHGAHALPINLIGLYLAVFVLAMFVTGLTTLLRHQR